MTATALTQQQIRAGLTIPGVFLGSNQFTFSIPNASSNWSYYEAGTEPFTGFAALLGSQVNMFRDAIAAWDAVILPDFTEVAETASTWGEIRVAYTSYSEINNVAGYAYLPERSAPGDIGSDIWINPSFLGPSDQAFLSTVFIHEIGHAIGLKHPFESPVLPADYDSVRYSVMSYTEIAQLAKSFVRSGGGGLTANFTYVDPVTPMVLDIAAVQYLYGADPDTGAGDTSYSFVQGVPPTLRAIYDASGNDTLDFSSFTRPNNIDLRPGAYSSIGIWSISEQIAYWTALFPNFAGFINQTLNDTNPPTYTWTDNLGIAFSTTIENVIGGSAADIFLGNDAANRFTGGLGNDTIDGGAGLDLAIFSGARGTYELTHFGGGRIRVSGADGTDMLVGVERLQFSDGLVSVPTKLFDLPSLGLATFGAGAGAGSWTSANLYPRDAADVNGDGLADIIGFGDGGVSVALAIGAGAFANPFLALATFGAGAGAGSWVNANLYPRATADVNGDGLADIVGFGDGGVSVALAIGGGAFANPILALATFGAGGSAGSWVNANLYPRVVADVNGDGQADLVGFGDGGVSVALATGGGSFANPFLALQAFGAGTSAGHWSSADLYPRLVADVNGDGKGDLIGFGDGGVSIALATGGGFFANPVLALATFGASAGAGGWTSDNLYPRTAADVDGNGKADLIGFGEGGVYIAISNGDGTFTTAILDLATFGAGAGAGSWTNNTLYPRIFADVDGDGTADLIGFGDGGVLISLASGFDIIA